MSYLSGHGSPEQQGRGAHPDGYVSLSIALSRNSPEHAEKLQAELYFQSASTVLSLSERCVL